MLAKNNPLIISNNSLVIEKVRSKNHFCLVEKDHLREIFIQARNLIHQNHKLLNHPQSGSIEPDRNPYRTIALAEAGKKVDLNSLNMIEHVINKYSENWPQPEDYSDDRNLLVDFRKLDYQLLKNFIELHK